MRFFIETKAQKIARLRQWRRVFAWLPHHVGNGEYCWLEWIGRRSTRREAPRGGSPRWFHEYIRWD